MTKDLTKIVNKSVYQLRRMKTTLSGDDEGLINTWDEICVQIQGEASIYWDIYRDTVESVVEDHFNALSSKKRAAIGAEFDDEFSYTPDAVTFLRNEVLGKAGSYSNVIIRNSIG